VFITLEGSEKKSSKRVVLGFFLPVARFHASPAPQRWRQAPLILTLRTSLVLGEWKEANSGCGHHIGRVQKEDLKTGRSVIFPPRCQVSCKPSATAVETSIPDVDFGDFFRVGGEEGSQLMWSSHWKGPKRRPQNGPFTDFSSSLPDFMQAQRHGGGDKRP